MPLLAAGDNGAGQHKGPSAAARGGTRPFRLMIFRGAAYTMAAPGASAGG